MLQDTLELGRVAADQAFERLIPAETQHPISIHKAMRHSVFAGGKRLRPILCREAGRMVAGSLPEGIDDLGAALEMLHTYSLIHDDLPALDNDDLRRGRPTCHVAFGEATAILAGDALQTQAYEVSPGCLSRRSARAHHRRNRARHRNHRRHDRGPGRRSGSRTFPARCENAGVHSSCKDSCAHYGGPRQRGIYAGGNDEEIRSLRSFGQQIGLAFQIIDDVLDVTQTSEQLGKTAGKDTAAEKATYPALFGIDESLKKADALVRGAFAELDTFGERAEILKALARYLVERKK